MMYTIQHILEKHKGSMQFEHAPGGGTIVTVTLPLDPSLGTGRVGAKAGFDLTWPFGTGMRLEARVPEPPRFEGKRFASVEAALADGPKYFEQLMTATGSRDGREIVRELDALRARAALDRDGEGRYLVKAAAKTR